MRIRVFDLILQGAEAKYRYAADIARDGAALSESEVKMREVWHSRPEGPEINGVQIWYCYGADYYFFEDVAGPEKSEEDF